MKIKSNAFKRLNKDKSLNDRCGTRCDPDNWKDWGAGVKAESQHLE